MAPNKLLKRWVVFVKSLLSLVGRRMDLKYIHPDGIELKTFLGKQPFYAEKLHFQGVQKYSDKHNDMTVNET